jgi:hypothetical protein
MVLKQISVSVNEVIVNIHKSAIMKSSTVLLILCIGNNCMASNQRNLSAMNNLFNELDTAKSEIDSNLFLYQTPDFQWIPSTVYRYDDFRESLSIMATEGVAGKTFYTGDDVENGYVNGMVNIAAFLAQSMKETIQYDACDENSVSQRCLVLMIEPLINLAW